MPYTAKYITTSDVTDSVARDFINGTDSRLDTWMTNTDREIESIAQSMDLSASEIETPIHYEIQKYAVAYYCFLIFQDAFGENAVEVDGQEIHEKKLKYWLEKCNYLRPTLTKAMFSTVGTSITSRDRIGGGQIWI
jgi:hypothetical protein